MTAASASLCTDGGSMHDFRSGGLMRNVRFNLPRLVLSAALCLAGPALAAQSFPTRPVTMVVPYAPGGSADVVGRLVAAEMSKTLGENVIIEMRPGAGGNIGAELVARSARPDGYTMLLGSLSL